MTSIMSGTIFLRSNHSKYTISEYNKVMETVVQFVGMEVKILSFE